MSDPVRLLDLDGDPMGASLLRAGLDDAPPPGAKDDVLRAIQGALGVAVIAGAVGVATNATAARSKRGAVRRVMADGPLRPCGDPPLSDATGGLMRRSCRKGPLGLNP